ncbi:MAG: hypothetical protein RIS67_644, partial [Pseudomonadota bacterium]
MAEIPAAALEVRLPAPGRTINGVAWSGS